VWPWIAAQCSVVLPFLAPSTATQKRDWQRRERRKGPFWRRRTHRSDESAFSPRLRSACTRSSPIRPPHKRHQCG
jgi:hypothetical protein